MLAPRPRRVVVPDRIEACTPAFGDVVHLLHGRSMGTTWSVRLVGSGRMDIAVIEQGIQQQLDAVVAQMSHWLPESDLCRFNGAAAASWHALPDDFFAVMQYALHVAQDSDGACDPAMGAVVDAWGFGPGRQFNDADFCPPTDARIDTARAQSGWHQLQIDVTRQGLWQPGGVRLDLSAIAKGHGVDRVSRYLAQQGIASSLVEVGGELRGSGIKPDGQPWWVKLQTPPGAEACGETVIALHGLSVATSGDYLRCFESDGTRHAHTLDPRTGRPITNGLASVSVIHAQCMHADALSTALTVMGLDAGLRWADARGIAALFIQRHADDGFTEHMSKKFAELAQ